MNFTAAFFKLIRWPNLVFIVLTQWLFKFCVIDKLLAKNNFAAATPLKYFILITIASVFIAAAGYIINDYFDLNIDQINKPQQLIIGKVVSRRWAILLHIILSTSGFVISLYVALKTNMFISLANLLCVLLLWFYSTTFKKKL